jgi:hypothetical protein
VSGRAAGAVDCTHPPRTPDSGPGGPGAAGRRSSRWARAVALRSGLLVGAYLAWGALWLLLVSGRSEGSVYRSDPGPVSGILEVLASVLVIATASVLWRVARRSHRPGVTCMVVGGLAGLLALLGALTVGIFIAPVAAFVILLGLPIAPEPVLLPPRWPVPPGWYVDPLGRASLRWWDGGAWTGYAVPVAVPTGP